MNSIKILKNYFELTKPRLVSLVLLSAVVGFVMATTREISWKLLTEMLIGTALTAGGSMALNQWMESERDARMKRTAVRPIPQNRISKQGALVFGWTLSISGALFLWVFVNPLSSFIAAATIVSYLFFYTPLKITSVYSTLVGAIPGALPPMIGWAAVHNTLGPGAWILFAIVFFWQMPHFLTLSWMLREQYRAADFKMLAVVDLSGEKVYREIVIYSVVMIPVSLCPVWIGMAGHFYFFGMLILGIGFLAAVLLCRNRLNEKARLLFRLSLLYLTFLQILMLFDKQ